MTIIIHNWSEVFVPQALFIRRVQLVSRSPGDSSNRRRALSSVSMRYSTPPTQEDIESLAADAFEKIPASLRKHVKGVAIRVVDFPDDETCEEMELESPFDLLGLYHGLPLDEKSVGDQPMDVDIIFLYRRPLLDHCLETDEELDHLVRHVLIHEIGHHFGLSDEAMEALEEQAGQ